MALTSYPKLDLPAEELLELSPYAVEARYDEAWSPDAEEARRALDVAERILALAARIVQAA